MPKKKAAAPSEEAPTAMGSPLSLSRPKRAAAAATDDKMRASLKEETSKITEEPREPEAKKPKAKAATVVAVKNPGPFKLERYFGLHEFTAKVLLSSSDVESLSVKELLAMCADAKDEASLALWDNLSLGYTESQGHPELLDEIAASYEGSAVRREHVLEVAPEEGILIAMSTLVEADDEVVVAWPAYQSLYEVAASRGAQLRRWRARGAVGERLRFDVADLEAQIAAAGGSVKLIIINFPHNPTGAWLEPAELQRVVELARRAGAWLFADEMYRGLEHGEVQLPSAVTLYERAVVLSGLSKTYAMPGLRMGWLACRDAGFMADACGLKDYTTICGSAPSQVAASRAAARALARRHPKRCAASRTRARQPVSLPSHPDANANPTCTHDARPSSLPPPGR
eukprot:699179-Prymnesium_polylepis.1